ncbi:phage protein, partial [Rhodopirellula maiorica SM1]
MIKVPNRAKLLALLEETDDPDDIAAIEAFLEECEKTLYADPEKKLSRAEKMRAASSKAQRQAVRDAQDIGRPPEGLGDDERRKQSDESLLFHLKTYHANTFCLEFSPDHLRLIKQIQDTLENGGQKAIALMRGAGKSSILRIAVLWAAITGRRRFVCLIAASSTSARKLMKAMKKTILTNRMLHADYAAELHCLISLGNRSTLAAGQHVEGVRTGVLWEAGMIASGYIEGVKTSEFVISCVSILGDVRGQQYITTTGETIRPDCALLDDPQTKASAKSKPASRNRIEIANADVLKMAGGSVNIAAFAAVTIIRKGDMADQLTDRKISPYWRGEKVPCVKKFPSEAAMELWSEFQEQYEAELELDAPHTGSKTFVEANFDAMHEGAELFWDANYDRKT